VQPERTPTPAAGNRAWKQFARRPSQHTPEHSRFTLERTSERHQAEAWSWCLPRTASWGKPKARKGRPQGHRRHSPAQAATPKNGPGTSPKSGPERTRTDGAEPSVPRGENDYGTSRRAGPKRTLIHGASADVPRDVPRVLGRHAGKALRTIPPAHAGTPTTTLGMGHRRGSRAWSSLGAREGALWVFQALREGTSERAPERSCQLHGDPPNPIR
jgi:hypothetical protein